MGTLQKPNESKGSKGRVPFDEQPEISDKEFKAHRKNEKKLEKEFQRIRGELEDIRQAFRYLDDAGVRDDIYFRLLQLEKTVSNVRKGGLLSRGAKHHRKLLRKLNESPIE